MTYDELCDQLAAAGSLSKREARRVVDITVQALSDALTRGDEVRLPAFGLLHVDTRPAKKGRNPRTGETIELAEKRIAKFRPSSVLTERLNAK